MPTLAIISDTHMPKGDRRLPDACVEALRTAELIIHAGDFTRLGVLNRLKGYGPPVRAVHGNVDEPALRAWLPETAVVRFEGVSVGLIHDAGPANGRLERLRRRFPRADAVIFGHSHMPLHERSGDGFQIFNPGSPTERRRAPTRTMGLARVEHGKLTFELIQLD